MDTWRGLIGGGGAVRNKSSSMKLYRFRHSPFARKVQTVLDLLGLSYEAVDVEYGERNELANLTDGYVYVPVLVTDRGQVLIESRAICQHLLAGPGAEWLAPSPLEGPIWGYADFVDNVLEDILFRVASPDTRKHWPSASDRALYTMNKERKFGPGCVEQWLRDRELLIARAQKLLEPSFRTLAQQRFLFGERPTLADAALHGQSLMLKFSHPELLPRVSPALAAHAQNMDEYLAARA
jgi:glutathione S-transferase